jgi:hypothetical protein
MCEELDKLEGEEQEILLALAEQTDGETIQETTTRYVQKMIRSPEYVTHFEVKKLADPLEIGIEVEVGDKDYKRERRIQIRQGAPQLRLLFHQNEGGAIGNLGHYDAFRLGTEEQRGLNLKLRNYLSLNNHGPSNNMMVGLWNARSIREVIKRTFLRNVLLVEEIKIAAVVGTFVINKDKYYFIDFKIVRGDGPKRRKGLCFLIHKALKVKVKKVQSDQEGRFLKIAITNEETRQSRTIEAIYMEPRIPGHPIIQLPEWIENCDYILGDLNHRETEW